jgi:hypothetical protein
VPKEAGEEELFASSISSGINFSKYESIPVNVSGENIPGSIKSFSGAGLRPLLLENITKCGYKVRFTSFNYINCHSGFKVGLLSIFSYYKT